MDYCQDYFLQYFLFFRNQFFSSSFTIFPFLFLQGAGPPIQGAMRKLRQVFLFLKF